MTAWILYMYSQPWKKHLKKWILSAGELRNEVDQDKQMPSVFEGQFVFLRLQIICMFSNLIGKNLCLKIWHLIYGIKQDFILFLIIGFLSISEGQMGESRRPQAPNNRVRGKIYTVFT